MDIPRRVKMQEWSKAERAIFDAKQLVEAMPPDTSLTDAVVLLGQAQNKVADFVDFYLDTTEQPISPKWLYPVSRQDFIDEVCKRLSNSLEFDEKSIVYVEVLSSGLEVRRDVKEGYPIPKDYKKMSLLKWKYSHQANKIADILEKMGYVNFKKENE